MMLNDLLYFMHESTIRKRKNSAHAIFIRGKLPEANGISQTGVCLYAVQNNLIGQISSKFVIYTVPPGRIVAFSISILSLMKSLNKFQFVEQSRKIVLDTLGSAG